ncbi:MAG: hypothetical protein ABIA93_02785 [Candidatus Woesearchaeota archaeon]
MRGLVSMKKAMATDFFVLLLILVVAIIIIYAVITLLFDFGKKGLDTQECSNSLRIADMKTFFLKDTNKAIKCDTTFTTLKGEDTQILNQISTDMIRCYKTFFKKTSEGYEQYKLFNEAGVFCVPCVIYEFEDENRQVPGLIQNLDNTPFPGTDATVLQQILSVEGTNRKSLEEWLADPNTMANEQTLDGNSQYAIIFAQGVTMDWVQRMLTGRRGNGGALGSSLIMGGAGAIGLVAGGTGSWVGGIGGVVAVGAGVFLTYKTVEPWLNDDAIERRSIITFQKYDTESLLDMGCTDAPNIG